MNNLDSLNAVFTDLGCQRTISFLPKKEWMFVRSRGLEVVENSTKRYCGQS